MQRDDGVPGMAELSLAGQVAVVVGAGQTPGDTIGNGRATSLLLAREGATRARRRPRPGLGRGDRGA